MANEMTAQELIERAVTKEYQDKAHIRAIIDEKEWWHVHRDEELPTDYSVVIYIRV